MKTRKSKGQKHIGKGKFCAECLKYTMRFKEDIDATQAVYQCTYCLNSEAK